MNHYSITRDKFMSVMERNKLLRFCKKEAKRDLLEQRRCWIVKFAIVHLALNSGLRVSELAALKIGDLHFNNNENYLVVQCGKRRKKRDVYLDQEIVSHLKNYLWVKENVWHESVEENSPLFAGRGGEHYTTTAIAISVKKAIIKAELSPHFSVHSCRHTYSVMLYQATNNILFLKKQLGHESIQMSSLYADVLPTQNNLLANRILNIS